MPAIERVHGSWPRAAPIGGANGAHHSRNDAVVYNAPYEICTGTTFIVPYCPVSYGAARTFRTECPRVNVFMALGYALQPMAAPTERTTRATGLWRPVRLMEFVPQIIGRPPPATHARPADGCSCMALPTETCAWGGCAVHLCGVVKPGMAPFFCFMRACIQLVRVVLDQPRASMFAYFCQSHAGNAVQYNG